MWSRSQYSEMDDAPPVAEGTMKASSSANELSPQCDPFAVLAAISVDENEEDAESRRTSYVKEEAVVKRSTERGLCWLYPPDIHFRIGWFFSIRGSEYIQIYLWIMKDLAWAQSWWIAGHLFGCAAVIWSAFILVHAVHERSTNEMFAQTGQLMWLFANTWWMIGDIHDKTFPDAAPWYPQRTKDCGNIMVAAIVLLSVYFLVVKPFKLLNVDHPVTVRHYDRTGLKPRWPVNLVFTTWREYENVHILFWLSKDCGWNHGIQSMWLVSVLPTLLIMLDFAWTSLWSRRLLVDHAHYAAQFLWVIANAIWAGTRAATSRSCVGRLLLMSLF
jgi:hypothetical protein